MNRDELEQMFVQAQLDSLEWEDIVIFYIDQQYLQLAELDDKELMRHIRVYKPSLLMDPKFQQLLK